MSILCTTVCEIRPEATADFVATLSGMFAVTATHEGFISIRLLKSSIAENEYIILQEWESIEHHQAYVGFRSEQGDLDRLAAFTAAQPLVHYWNTAPLAST